MRPLLGWDHEQVVLVTDPPTGLRAIIAVHSTALGPSLGGIRFWTYPDPVDALQDALRLSEAMTLKAAVAGLDQGGGKAVVILDRRDSPKPRDLLHALGRAVNELGGRYLAAEDVGATTADMDVIAEVTPWVTGVSESVGGSGDPAPVTAAGVLAGMKAALAFRDGDAALDGRRVVVIGVGHVGRQLVDLLAAVGATVLVTDIDGDRALQVATACDAQVIPLDGALFEVCDVLAPCALGGILTTGVVPQLRCRVICGAANNQLAEPQVDDALMEAGIIYAPDFVVNAGGIINIAGEFTGYDRAAALTRTERIGSTTTQVLERARTTGIPPGRAAIQLARSRLDAAGRSQWQPGAPTAWTDGAPLRRLRPL